MVRACDVPQSWVRAFGESGCLRERGNSVGDQDGGEHAVGLVSCVGEEVLDLGEKRVEVAAASEPDRVVAWLFEVTESGNVALEQTTV